MLGTKSEMKRYSFQTDQKLCEKFDIKDHNYTQQYASLYFCRLNVLRNQVLKNCRDKWKQSKHVNKVLDVSGSDLSYIIGTVFCEFGNKPNILKEITTDQWGSSDPSLGSYRSEDPEENKIMLEDESGRVLLTGDAIKQIPLVTGIVIGVLGREVAGGAFEVCEICYPRPLSSQTALSELIVQKDCVGDKEKPKWIAFVSDLAVGDESSDNGTTQMLFDYLSGDFDAAGTAEISKLIIAGNSLKLRLETEKERENARWSRSKKDSDANESFLEPVQLLDRLVASAAASLSIDILSGPTDPAPQRLPQDPMPRGLFALSRQFSQFATASNPYKSVVDGICIVGDAGQSLDDIRKYYPDVDCIKLAESALLWQHLAPTCPDTLWCYPFKNSDPFILDETPHVYFIGNQERLDTSEYVHPDTGAKTRVLLIPSFRKTKQLILMNSQTLAIRAVNFL